MISRAALEASSGFTAADLELLAQADPEMAVELTERMKFETIEAEREEYEGSLIKFFQRAWREIDPARLSVNWHHMVIAEELEQIAYGFNRNLIINIPPRHTKALDVNTPVLTTWGWKRHGDLEQGDFVFGPDGLPKRVLGVSPQTVQRSYSVEFDDKASLIASGDHLWAVERDHPYGTQSGHRCRKPEVVTTALLVSAEQCKDETVDGRRKRNKYRPDRIPVTAALRIAPRHFLIEPYILGAWLGDGSTTSAILYVGTQDIEHFRSLGSTKEYTNGQGLRLFHVLVPELQTKLRVMGLLGNKHIPEDYLESSIDQRWELLRGLMDTDGTAAASDGVCSYTTKLLNLAKDVQTLTCSLGIKSMLRETWTALNGVKHGPYYQVAFVAPQEAPPIFKLARKQALVRPSQNPRSRGRYLQRVEAAGEHLVNCIKVEGELYLAGRQFICTHNTMLTNVIWPAWVWCQSEILPLAGPHVKFLCVSYGATLAEEIALKMRRLIQGEWYQRLWGERVKIQPDQQNRANFENTAGGARISNSIEGGILGRGGDVRIVDDPQTRKGADSEAQRAESLRGMSDLTTRVTDPRISAQVLIMQRLQLNDATDWALKNWPKNAVHLMFPARFEEARACNDDPRKREGELLWPEVWTDEELTKIENGLAALDGELLSDYAISGQLQQNPISRSGGIITDQDWEVWPEYEPSVDQLHQRPDGSYYIPLPQVSHVLMSLDTAIDEKTTSDWNACVIMGVWHRPRRLIQIAGSNDNVDDGEQPRVILMGGWRARCKLNDETPGRNGQAQGLVQRVQRTAQMFGVDRIIIENKTRGADVRNELQRQFSDMPYHIQMFEPGRHGDKVARLHAVQPLFAQRLVYAPGLATLAYNNQGQEYVRIDEFQWVKDIMNEVQTVPRGQHDDFSDALSQALLVLRDEGFLQLTREYIAQQMALRTFQRQPRRVAQMYGVG